MCQSNIQEFLLYRVSESSWQETFVASVAASLNPDGSFSGYINQATLGSNELTGAEVYSISCVAVRKRKKLLAKSWFNHLGIYDSMLRLKQEIDMLQILKKDE